MDGVGEIAFLNVLIKESSGKVFSSIVQHRDFNTEQVLVHKLHISCEAHFYDVAWGLIDEFGVDVNAAFRLLGADPEDGEEHEKSLLHRVCSTANYAEAEGELPTTDFALKLLMKGADINYVCADGTTPLQKSLRRGRWEISRELLRRGARGQAPPDSADGQPLDILLCLRYDPDIEIAESIIANGGDITAMDKWGFTALHSAAMRCDCPAIVEYFISKGALLNHPGHKGFSPLHCAALASYFPTSDMGKSAEKFEQCAMRNVNCLLNHGANIDFTDTPGRTALHSAYANGSFAVAAQLERAGAATLRDENGKLPREYIKEQQLKKYRERCWARRRNFVLFLREHGLLLLPGAMQMAVDVGAMGGTGGMGEAGGLPVFRMLVAKDVQSHILSFL
jgi:ankyrin repeat protein